MVYKSSKVNDIYSDYEVGEDIKRFFRDPEHWAYEFGTPSETTPNSPYHIKQLVVLFEEKYFHWVTERAINNLIREGFLMLKIMPSAYFDIHFVYRSDIRYIIRKIKERVKLIERYSDPDITKGVGDYAEMLFDFGLFRANGFTILGKNTNDYGGRKWTPTNHNLDYIIEKDSIVYGVEIKNTLAYMEPEEFDIKIKICSYLGVIPLWILRNAPDNQFDEMKNENGFILKFKTQIYPPGQEPLVRDIWKLTRLPVGIWKAIPPKIEKAFLD